MTLFSTFSRIKHVNRRTWALAGFIGLVIVSITLLALTVDLAPKVGSDFFFSSDNPSFQYARLITKLFPSQSSQIIITAEGDLSSPEYFRRISVMTELISLFPSVISVKSLSSGPDGYADAVESPLWRRLLISSGGSSSNIIAFVGNTSPQYIIPKVESAIALVSSPSFRPAISGVPYVVEMIRRNLSRDLVVFSLVALAVFGVVMVAIFRSVRIYLGTMIACVEACVITLAILGTAGIQIGILTVNLATIVFVLTLSHIIFITHNWKNIQRGAEQVTGRRDIFSAVRMTFAASFWCMITTLLGFLSLLFVAAKPLRELGIGGSIGTVAAIFSAYFVYPLFLWFVKPPKRKAAGSSVDKTRSFFIRKAWFPASVLVIFAVICAFGINRLNTDPSLFAFFAKGTDLRTGLEHIDSNGGSSPLDLIVRDSQGATLDTNMSYKRLWQLQEALESDPNVGSVISLPVLMAEGHRAPLAFLLNWETLLKWMKKPEYGRISRSFITDDHISGRFLLRMKESARNGSRTEVVLGLKQIVAEHGFVAEMVGGLYLLQGELAKLVTKSLVFGLGRLIAAFIIIALIVSRSVRTSLAMVFSLALVPVCVFGIAGYARIPVDIISAPAVNVAIGMGIDSMIHMASAVRRRRVSGIDPGISWIQARVRLWQPVLSSMFIICAGFAIFGLSAFPPTRRFGLEIVIGTVVASLAALFVLPALARTGSKRSAKD